jgi:hypothetical protein
MDRPQIATFQLGVVSLFAVLVVGGCSSAGSGTTGTPPSPGSSVMTEHSSMPSESAMAEHSAAPSGIAPVSTGMFHAVDGTATGTVALFHKADGTFAITFENFTIASDAHTDVILVTNKDVTKDGDIDKAALVDLGPLKGTSGMQDFVVPASADAMTFHTVVLWDTAMTHAIAAAPLQ